MLPSVRFGRIILNEKRNHSRGRHLNFLLPYAEQFDGFARYLAWHAFTDDRWVTEQLLANCRYFFLLLPHISNDEDDEMVKSFDDAVDKIAARDRVPRTVAMGRARAAFPDLYERYQREGRSAAIINAATKPVAKSGPARRFEALIDKVQDRDGCSRFAALTKAAREFPTERVAYSSALA